MEIIPAILPYDFEELEEKVNLVKGYVETVQIDICDGQFTPEASWPYRKSDENFQAILEEKQGLPGWEDVDFEIHLMVKNPEEVIQEWITAGAKRIIIHPKSTEKLEECIKMMEGIVEIGFAFDITEPVHIVNGIDFIQLMGIENIGKQGEPFDERVIEKINETIDENPFIQISIDGGVNLENAGELVNANRLVIGSAIFESENIPQTIEEFRSIISK